MEVKFKFFFDLLEVIEEVVLLFKLMFIVELLSIMSFVFIGILFF